MAAFAILATLAATFALFFVYLLARRVRTLEGRIGALEVASKIRVGETENSNSDILSQIHVLEE